MRITASVEEFKVDDFTFSAGMKRRRTKDRTFFSHTQAIMSREAARWGFESQDVESDGDCFFHAIVDQLAEYHPQIYVGFTEEDFRQRTLARIEKYIESYWHYIPNEHPGDYLRRMQQSNAWVDPLTIAVFSREFNLTLAIINSDGSAPIIFKRPEPRAVLYLGYIINLHYQSLHFQNELAAAESIEQVIDTAEVHDFHEQEPLPSLVDAQQNMLFVSENLTPEDSGDDLEWGFLPSLNREG